MSNSIYYLIKMKSSDQKEIDLFFKDITLKDDDNNRFDMKKIDQVPKSLLSTDHPDDLTLKAFNKVENLPHLMNVEVVGLRAMTISVLNSEDQGAAALAAQRNMLRHNAITAEDWRESNWGCITLE